MTTPAPRLLIPNGVQLTLRLTQNGQAAVVVLGARSTAAVPITPANAAAWRDAAWTAFRPFITNGVNCDGAIMRRVSELDGAVVEVGAPAVPQGGHATTPALAAGCTLIKWSTGRGGRSGKGRTYFPGLAQSSIGGDGRTYVSTHATTVATAISNYLAAALVPDNDLKPAVLSFTKGEANLITAGSLAPVVGVQRRRMRG